MASKVSEVPAETIRRIATEYAEAAQIGSTITIDGHQLPFRPVASVTFRGVRDMGMPFTRNGGCSSTTSSGPLMCPAAPSGSANPWGILRRAS